MWEDAEGGARARNSMLCDCPTGEGRRVPRVLVIEDDEETAAEIVAELTRHGFAVDRAATGPEGLALAGGGAYAAITVDRMLPGLDGLSIVAAIRRAGIRTP